MTIYAFGLATDLWGISEILGIFVKNGKKTKTKTYEGKKEEKPHKTTNSTQLLKRQLFKGKKGLLQKKLKSLLQNS